MWFSYKQHLFLFLCSSYLSLWFLVLILVKSIPKHIFIVWGDKPSNPLHLLKCILSFHLTIIYEKILSSKSLSNFEVSVLWHSIWSFCYLLVSVKKILSLTLAWFSLLQERIWKHNTDTSPHSALANFRMRLGLGVPFLYHGQLSLFQSKRWLSVPFSITSFTFWNYLLDRYGKTSMQPPSILPSHS